MPMRQIAALFVMLLPAVGATQSLALRPPLGLHEYRTRGFYDRSEMEPWAAALTVVDSTIGGHAGVRAEYRSRFENGHYLFVYAVSWLRAEPRRMTISWRNNGQSVSDCRLATDSGRLTGTVSGVGKIAPIAFAHDVVPDFALGAYFATRPLQDGDSARITVVRCLPGSEGDPVRTLDITVTTRKSTESRGGATAQAAWLVEGSEAYPFKAWIASDDRMVLKTVSPQGSVGRSEDTYVVTHPVP
jgi:hypothetical protein